MGWRTVLISGRAKLDLKLNNMVVRKEETTKIHIKEISILIIDSVTVSITTALIEKLVEEKIKIIFTDSSHNPIGEIVNYYNKHDSVLAIKKQIKWSEKTKKQVWTYIIQEKIRKQRDHLKSFGLDSYKILDKYIEEIELGDITNREGHAAKVYFNSLFGNQFSRSKDDPINSMLNFGYSILLSIFTKEITSSGYLTQLGIFHDNQFNFYNLASDFMEPLRPLIDKTVIDYYPEEFGKNEKFQILKILERNYHIDNKNCTLLNAVSIYCRKLFESLEKNDIEIIEFIEYEL